MNRIAETFGRSSVLLPVVHPIGRQEALAAVRVAHDLGVPGVFLIDQGMHERDLLALVCEVRDLYPSLWIGVNLLSRSPADALSTAIAACGSIDGIWSDDAGIDEHGSAHPRSQAFDFVRGVANWRGLYFGGVAFKYQREVAPENLGRAAELAAPYMDVLCTSGPGTGHAATVEKVCALREGLGDHAMALASGVTPENVHSYLPYVQAFLVGTGIEDRLGVFDPAKIEALMQAMDDCDDYIDDPSAHVALRKFLEFARSPAHGQLLVKPHPLLFADYKGQRVRVTMASRLGDVGISTDLNAESSYDRRVLVRSLSNFSETP